MDEKGRGLQSAGDKRRIIGEFRRGPCCSEGRYPYNRGGGGRRERKFTLRKGEKEALDTVHAQALILESGRTVVKAKGASFE